MHGSKRLAWTKPMLLATALALAGVTEADAAPCGNGVLQGAEQCDLGALNGTPGSCCSAACTFEPSSTECRASTDQCDTAEFCSGASDTCPADALAAAGIQCRAAAGSCDAPEACTGASAQCPVDEVVPAGTECREAAGVCDVPEFCDGALAECPTDLVATLGTPCGDGSDTACDNPDSCDGAGSCVANYEPATTGCRDSAGECDAAEFCDGAGSCPGDALAEAGTPCGDASQTACDNPDICDGSGTCLANFAPPTSECRPADGDCDLAELCDGEGSCPTDAFVAAATVCRPLAGACDVVEACTGSEAACPPDGFQDAGSACRPAAGSCDVADTCTGTSAECADELVAAGTVCRPDTGTCDVAEACTGAGVACPPDASITVDFDDAPAPGAFADAAPLTNQYAALGVVWQGTGAVLDEATLPDLAGQSPPNFAAYADGEPLLGGTSGSADAMELACPSQEVSFYVGAESTAIFVAEAFDTIGTRLDDVALQVDPDLQQVTLQTVDGLITRIEYETFSSDEGGSVPRFAVDSLFVPEPDAPLVQLAVLAALGVLTGRRPKQ